jgi:hypothetical protein
MEHTTFSLILTVIVAGVIIFVPWYVIYHLVTRNGRGHVRLRHRAASRAIRRAPGTGRVRDPIQVRPIPYRWVVVACAAIGLFIVVKYLYF